MSDQMPRSEGERILETLQFIEVEMRRTRQECEKIAKESRFISVATCATAVVIILFMLFLGFIIVAK